MSGKFWTIEEQDAEVKYEPPGIDPTSFALEGPSSYVDIGYMRIKKIISDKKEKNYEEKIF